MIKTICKPRLAGKTFEAIKECSQIAQSVIVCINRQEACRVADLARDNGIKIPHPITLDEAMGSKLEGSMYVRLILDNVDMMLPMIFRRTISAMTLLGKDELGHIPVPQPQTAPNTRMAK